MKLHLLTDKQLETLIGQRVAQALEEENRNYEKEILLKQANLETLQSQINPHFLYNTLECIRGMALMVDQPNIADIAWSLSRFFRYSISGKANIVTLREELDNARSYVNIQNYRFGNRFQLEIGDISGIEDVWLPKLTLQPVIENAILHGLQDRTEGGRLQILFTQIGGDLCIAIRDNGCGMTPEALERLTDRIKTGGSAENNGRAHTGIGMYNVDRRLKLYFGPEYGMTVYSCEKIGTTVELRIPCRKQVAE